MAFVTPGMPGYRLMTFMALLRALQHTVPPVLVAYLAIRHQAWLDPIVIVGLVLWLVIGFAWRAILRGQVRKLGPLPPVP
jgi:hypothetical protein